MQVIQAINFQQAASLLNRTVASVEVLSETINRTLLVNSPYQHIEAKVFPFGDDEVLRVVAGGTAFSFSSENYYARKEGNMVVLADKYSLHSTIIEVKDAEK